MASTIILSDNGASSGSAGLKTTGGNDGVLQLQTTTSGGTATTAVSISNTQIVTVTNDTVVNGLTVGKGAGSVSTNTAVGASALAGNTSTPTGTNNLAVGYQAGFNITSGGYQTAVGASALKTVTTGTENTAVGYGALESTTTGSYNVAQGLYALRLNTTASNSTAVGYQAAYSSSTGSHVTAFGYKALYSSTVSNFNVAVGSLALTNWNNTGTDGSSVAVGYQALTSATTANFNTAVGYQAGYSGTVAANNTFVGYQAGYANNSGGAAYNTFVGYGAGSAVTGGYKHSILGAFSGNQSSLDIRTANNYVVLSDGDGFPWIVGGVDGYTIAVNSPASYCQLDWRINNARKAAMFWDNAAGRFYTFTTVNGPYVSTGGTSWTNSSDERLKNITGEIQNGLTKVCSLRAAEYTWKADEEAKPQVGLIAQDVLAVLPQAVDVPPEGAIDKDGSPSMMGVQYTQVIPLLVAAIKELKAELDTAKAEIAALKGTQP